MSAGPLGTITMVALTLYVADLDAAIAWYADKFGLAPIAEGKDGHRYASYMFASAIVVLEPIEAALEPEALGSDNTTLNVLVEDDPVAVRDALMARGVVCGEMVLSPNFASFLVRDLDGNRFYVTRATTDRARATVADLA